MHRGDKVAQAQDKEFLLDREAQDHDVASIYLLGCTLDDFVCSRLEGGEWRAETVPQSVCSWRFQRCGPLSGKSTADRIVDTIFVCFSAVEGTVARWDGD